MNPHLTLPGSIMTDSAVYGWRRDGKYLYIGQAISLVRRLAVHHIIKREDMGPTDMIDIWFCDVRLINSLERQLIKSLKPSYNKMHNRTSQELEIELEKVMTRRREDKKKSVESLVELGYTGEWIKSFFSVR